MPKKVVKKNLKKTPAGGEASKYAGILIRGRVTEKASLLQSQNVHVFEVAEGAGKKEIGKAVKDIHKVTPQRINIVRNPAKTIFMKGRKGLSGGVKKAYVFLKTGDKIEQ